MRLRWRVVGLTAALFAACGLQAWGAATTPCRVDGIAHQVQCGSVARPLDPARADGRTIAIHYVVVPALARRRLPDPVLLLAGGPGQSAIGLAGSTLPLFARLNNRRDIVFVDQRGTGRSAPLLCDDTRHAPLAEAGDPEAQLATLRRCREQLRKLPYAAQPADLGLFSTWIASQDLDAVRAQLGAERVNLVGASYGTRAALDYQRQFPARVRRAVLDGVAPPDMALPASSSADAQAVLDSLLRACASEPACARRHPRLADDWHALLASLPRTVTVAHPSTGERETFELRRGRLLAAVRAPLYVPALASALPAALSAAAQEGRFEPLFALGAALAPRTANALAMGMHFSVICSEDLAVVAPPQAAPPGADFGDGFEQLYRRACADWPRGTVPAAFYTLPAAATPVLLLSGGLDPATPPRHGERVARALGAKARHVVVPNAGHGLLGIGCARDLLWRFIDADDDAAALALDAGCLAAIPRPPAFAAAGSGSAP